MKKTCVGWCVQYRMRMLKKLFRYCYIHEENENFQRVVDFNVGQITMLLDELAILNSIDRHPVYLGVSFHRLSYGRNFKERWKSFLEIIGFKPKTYALIEDECLD